MTRLCREGDGEPTADPRSPRRPYIDDFTNPDGCHPWIGARQPNGYGLKGVKDPDTRKGWRSLTVARMIVAGREGLDYSDKSWDTRHLCEFKPCCRSEHLTYGTHRDNIMDIPIRAESGYRGVNQNGRGRWQARIMHQGKRRYLGTFDDPREASAAYETAYRELIK